MIILLEKNFPLIFLWLERIYVATHNIQMSFVSSISVLLKNLISIIKEKNVGNNSCLV